MGPHRDASRFVPCPVGMALALVESLWMSVVASRISEMAGLRACARTIAPAMGEATQVRSGTPSSKSRAILKLR